MKSVIREKVKFLLLVFLILTSLIQIGILWSYQNHGLPFNILSGFFAGYRNSISFSTAREEYFKPYRIIASEGDGENRLITDDSEFYNDLCNDLIPYIKDILTSKTNRKPEQLPADAWYDIAGKKALIYEFKTNIDLELVSWFLNTSGKSSVSPSGIYKIAVTPWEDVNYNLTAYIFDGKYVYSYVLPIHEKRLSKDSCNDVFTKLWSDSGLRSYYVAKAYFSKKKDFKIGQDILCAVSGSKYDPFSKLICLAPDMINNIDKLAEGILGNKKDLFDVKTDMRSRNSAIVFKNQNNIYRIYSDGMFEYKYIYTQEENESEKLDLKAAFAAAVNYINNVKEKLLPGAELYISGIRRNSENKCFDFTFDYIKDNIPIYVQYDSNDKSEGILNNAVKISSNSKRVTECRWILKKLEWDTGEKQYYNINFVDLMDYISNASADSDYRNFSIKDMDIAYKVTFGVAQALEPEWVIKKMDDTIITVPVQVKKEAK